ncbi:P-loop NTPase fold protein [Halodesulfovibrio aestuarii]|uniref:P-loop NTPase fold protein n=1 Tax=Halodesulfovibrio aestuarii TaxID=126333 RepID=A0ABV4JR15_9BACT
MRLFPKPLEIGEFEGFTKKKDIFNREDFGIGLQRLFERVDEPLTVILDSPWGTGKSTFIEMWCGHMRQQGFPVIHFDAFKHDHVDDAFGALAGEVFAKAEEYCTAVKDQEKGELLLSGEQRDSLKNKAKNLFNVTRRFGKVVLKTGVKEGAKRLAEKAVGEDAAAEQHRAVKENLLNTAKFLTENSPCRFSLRTIEKVMAQLRLWLLTLNDDYTHTFSSVLLTLAVLKVCDQEKFEGVLSGGRDLSVLDIWGITAINDSLAESELKRCQQQWRAFNGEGTRLAGAQVVKSFRQNLRSFALCRKVQFPQLADEIEEQKELKEVS